ncbi:dienelactone hydrolase family protein [Cucurbitaria berberidis CBS 394.84]|uniref:Dienelactone hydrolase family protein n=1 Tax=Cucurbitaria berberidis CBS 394.84 TaxID=1168544 RepID=A0A9P4GR36_9PLEO|nr:dienelactone hydrolase family protein [Cucurbitaria berberidis CBS 394.84]KAF1849792.1 dienelactone hydrolase family protein [Cucurbitaria berberidis CBS 394.84]
MSCENCKTGFKWNGTPTGKESTLNNAKAYVAGDSKEAAIVIITDIFGWTLPNIRILADHYAKEANATVYVPDIFDGEVVDPDALSDPEKAKNFDLGAFLNRHNKEARWPEIKAAAQTLKSQYSKVIAIGFCYGAWACLKLAADPSLIDAISVAHPSMLEKSEIDSIKVPIQVIAPENDFMFTDELKKYTLDALPKTGVQWEYVYFPGLQHGFAARGNPNDPKQKAGLERAKRSAVNFFNEFLH